MQALLNGLERDANVAIDERMVPAKGTGGGAWPKTGTTHDRWIARLCLLFIGLAAVALLDGIEALRTEPVELPRVATAAAAAATALLTAVALGRYGLRQLTVDVDGIETRDRAGRITRILWTEPHELLCHGVASSGTVISRSAIVRTPDGRRIEVADSNDADSSLVPLVRRLSTEANWVSIHTQILQGERVAFGPVGLSALGLDIGPTVVELAELSERVVVTRGILELRGLRRWGVRRVRVPLRRVTNAPALFRALAELGWTAPSHVNESTHRLRPACSGATWSGVHQPVEGCS